MFYNIFIASFSQNAIVKEFL